MSLFRPPIVRSAAGALDRSLFRLTVPTAAARVTNPKNIARFRTELGGTREILKLDRFINVKPDPAGNGGKCLVLKPEIAPEDPSTWSALLKEAVEEKEVGVFPYNLELGYDYWTYYDIMTSVLPLDAQGEIPVGFTAIGHIAHLNLRTEYLPFKTLIATVLMDKNPTVRTVINKIDDVGNTENEFRTFKYEVLAGPDEMNVEVSEEECVFAFDYSKVYWNSRLQTEHKRLVSRFKKGEVVCDVMAGVGPFAVPAGKKGVFVWANDLNPASFEALCEAIKRNKVTPFVRPFCQNGHTFIPDAADFLLASASSGTNKVSIPARKLYGKNQSRSNRPPTPPPTIRTIPPTISHFVMNLPASALSFLPSFIGLYAGHEGLFCSSSSSSTGSDGSRPASGEAEGEIEGGRKLPTIHAHCFSTKSADNMRESIEIAERVGVGLGLAEGVMRAVDAEVAGAGERELEEYEVRVWDVREVAPKKRMFCAEFRLPREVAFRERVSGWGGTGS